jgi:hypothetical protein
MPMQEINIKIRIVNGKIGTIINQTFEESIESVHTFIGILENIKQQQLEKLKTDSQVFKR